MLHSRSPRPQQIRHFEIIRLLLDLVVKDCLSFFNFIKKYQNQNPQFQKLGFQKTPNFLYGESMGGLIRLLIHLPDPKGFDGAALVEEAKSEDNWFFFFFFFLDRN
ncbi:hypothetical protein CsatB_017057 [Cannabis sativa]